MNTYLVSWGKDSHVYDAPSLGAVLKLVVDPSYVYLWDGGWKEVYRCKPTTQN